MTLFGPGVPTVASANSATGIMAVGEIMTSSVRRLVVPQCAGSCRGPSPGRLEAAPGWG